MTTLTKQERNAVTTACKYALQDYGRDWSLPEPNIISKERKLLESALDKLSPAPKYDPCRLFKKGDRVRVVECKGRNHSGVKTGKIGIVDGDEHPNDPETIEVVFEGDDALWGVEACYLELVTPVEELEPYQVVDAHTHWDVADENMKTVAIYSKGYHPHAKEAAEAECDRLNAEWRKEQE